MIVDSAIEDSGGISSNVGLNDGASWVVVDEDRNIVDDVIDDDDVLARRLSVVDIGLSPKWKSGNIGTPVDLLADLFYVLLSHLSSAHLDFVGWEDLQVVGKTEESKRTNEPFGWVVVIELDSVSVVIGELVVEVVVTLAKGEKSSDDGITRSVLVTVGVSTEVVSQAVDAESGMVNEHKTQNSSVEISASPIAPSETANECWNRNSPNERQGQVVSVLPADERIGIEIRNVGKANGLRVLLLQHPTHVRPDRKSVV